MPTYRSNLKNFGPTASSNTELYFCPNGNVAQTIGRKNFSEQKRKMIRPLHTLDKRWNFVILLHFALWLVTAWMAVSTSVFVLNIVCYLIGGLALSTLSVLAHESAHNLFTRHPKIDRRIGLFCGLPILFSAGAYRIVHPIHHAKLRTPEDPDDFETTAVRFKLLPLVYILTSLIGVYLYQLSHRASSVSRGAVVQPAKTPSPVAGRLS
jgi:fatty acid desaturase